MRLLTSLYGIAQARLHTMCTYIVVTCYCQLLLTNHFLTV